MAGTIDPARFGMPDATTTGVSSGTTLTAYTGPMTITKDGTVIENKIIDGATLKVLGDNVTIKNCVIKNYGMWGVDADGAANITVQNCDFIASSSQVTNAAILGSGTFVGNDISNGSNGIVLQAGASVVRGNYIHDLRSIDSDAHIDGISVQGGQDNVLIDHNTIESWDTSCIIIKSDFGPINNITVRNNLMYGDADRGDPAATVYVYGPNTTNVTIANNYVEKGNWFYYSTSNANPTITGNIEWDNKTAAIPYPTSSPTAPTTPAPSTPTAPATPNAPTISSFSRDSGVVGDLITNDNTLTLTGTAAANSAIKVYDGITQIGATTANSNGSWSYTTAALNDAKHTLTATATNGQGKTSSASANLGVTIDTTAPTAPTIASTSGGTTQSVNARATSSSDNVVKLTGTAESKSSIDVFDGSSKIGTATAAADGTWSFTTGQLSTGQHTFTANATDVAGNLGKTSTVLSVNVSSPTSQTAGKVIESAGATKVFESGDKYYLNSSSGSGPSLKYQGVDFVDGKDGTWAPIAAEKTTTGYQVVWKEASTGLYTAWNTDSNGNYASHVSTLTGSKSGGAVAGTNSGLKLLETSFHQDLNGDGQIGTSSAGTPAPPTPTSGKVIESAGATSLVASGEKYYLNNSSGSGPALKYHGVDFVHGTDGTWAPIAAEKTTTGYQVVWKEASTGLYTAWNTDSNGNYASHVSTLTGSESGGAVSGTNSGLKLLETSYHQDLNGDGRIGTSSVAAPTQINSADKVVATSGETMVGTGRSDTLTSTTGNDIMVGKGGSDTFVFAPNFGNDVIKDFGASGWGNDKVQFSKSAFDNFADVLAHATQAGGDVVIATDHGDLLTLKNTKLAALDKSDFHFA